MHLIYRVKLAPSKGEWQANEALPAMKQVYEEYLGGELILTEKQLATAAESGRLLSAHMIGYGHSPSGLRKVLDAE